jgi:hypothetical protein
MISKFEIFNSKNNQSDCGSPRYGPKRKISQRSLHRKSQIKKIQFQQTESSVLGDLRLEGLYSNARFQSQQSTQRYFSNIGYEVRNNITGRVAKLNNLWITQVIHREK